MKVLNKVTNLHTVRLYVIFRMGKRQVGGNKFLGDRKHFTIFAVAAAQGEEKF